MSFKNIISREDILKQEQSYYNDLQHNFVRCRKTKIMCTVSEKTASYNAIKSMYEEGMNILRFNLAFIDLKVVEVALENKNILERELNCFIPAIVDLKGNYKRIGRFEPPYQVVLKKGQVFRLVNDLSIVGDHNIVACELGDYSMIPKPGDKLLIDNSQVILTVQGKETLSDTLQKLAEMDQEKYQNGLPRREKELSIQQKDQNISISLQGPSKPQKTRFSRSRSRDQLKNLDSSSEDLSDLKNKTQKEDNIYVIVCRVENDCILRSEKPYFIQSDKQLQKDDNSDEDEYEIPILSKKDLLDLNKILALDIEALAISDVKNDKEIKQIKELLQTKNSSLKIIAKIQNKQAIQNFESILQEADGIMLIRSYLLTEIDFSKGFLVQSYIFQRCQEAGKPLIVASQLLESMIKSVMPTSSEINDIGNLIMDGVDCLSLVRETFIGDFYKEAIGTLARLCLEIESKQKKQLQQTYSKERTLIISAIAQCCVKAIRSLNASAVIIFTSTGKTVVEVSKLKPMVPIIAVTEDDKLGRQLSVLSSVFTVQFGCLFGQESLVRRVIEYAKEKQLVKSGDFVLITYGNVMGLAGRPNTIKIEQVS